MINIYTLNSITNLNKSLVMTNDKLSVGFYNSFKKTIKSDISLDGTQQFSLPLYIAYGGCIVLV